MKKVVKSPMKKWKIINDGKSIEKKSYRWSFKQWIKKNDDEILLYVQKK